MAGLSYRGNRSPGHVEIDDPKWHGYLANITPGEFNASYAESLPSRISGAEFLRRYTGITDSVTSVNPAREYPVYQATRHPINENERVKRFEELLSSAEPQRGRLLGELMYEAHKGYSDCGLGSAGTDEIVSIVREQGPERGLFGAKITGGGSGGTVAVLGSRDAWQSVKWVAREYGRRSGYKPLVISGSSPGSVRFGHLSVKREVE
jgi:L-arabinokinase